MADQAGPLDALELVALDSSRHARTFETLVADRLDGYGDLLNAIDATGSRASGGGAGGVDGAYNRQVVPAIEATAAHVQSLETTPTGAILEAADTGDQLRQSVQKYLPGADAPIDIAFVPDPPGPPGTPPPGPTPPEGKD